MCSPCPINRPRCRPASTHSHFACAHQMERYIRSPRTKPGQATPDSPRSTSSPCLPHRRSTCWFAGGSSTPDPQCDRHGPSRPNERVIEVGPRRSREDTDEESAFDRGNSGGSVMLGKQIDFLHSKKSQWFLISSQRVDLQRGA